MEKGFDRTADDCKISWFESLVLGAWRSFDSLTEMNLLNAGFQLPIIMVSANSSTKQILQGLEQGANDYITKPFHRDDLTMRLVAHLRFVQLLDAELHVRVPYPHHDAALTPQMLVRDLQRLVLLYSCTLSVPFAIARHERTLQLDV